MPATPASFYLQNVSTYNRIAETTKALDVYITGSAAARVSDVRESIAKYSKARTSRGFCTFSIGGWDYPAFQAGFRQLLLQKQNSKQVSKTTWLLHPNAMDEEDEKEEEAQALLRSCRRPWTQ